MLRRNRRVLQSQCLKLLFLNLMLKVLFNLISITWRYYCSEIVFFYTFINVHAILNLHISIWFMFVSNAIIRWEMEPDFIFLTYYLLKNIEGIQYILSLFFLILNKWMNFFSFYNWSNIIKNVYQHKQFYSMIPDTDNLKSKHSLELLASWKHLINVFLLNLLNLFN